MSNFTKEQKAALVMLAKTYDPRVFEIVSTGGDGEITVKSEAEAAALEAFSSKICDLVLRDHPDFSGEDEDVNADAEMVVHMISDILAELDLDA